jgi:hypothetical protein
MDRAPERLFELYGVDLDMPQSDGMAVVAITLTGGFRNRVRR